MARSANGGGPRLTMLLAAAVGAIVLSAAPAAARPALPSYAHPFPTTLLERSRRDNRRAQADYRRALAAYRRAQAQYHHRLAAYHHRLAAYHEALAAYRREAATRARKAALRLAARLGPAIVHHPPHRQRPGHLAVIRPPHHTRSHVLAQRRVPRKPRAVHRRIAVRTILPDKTAPTWFGWGKL